MERIDGRKNDELRPVEITVDYTFFPEGSVLIQIGRTIVLCTATVEKKVPPFLKGSGQGWITSEYSMLPRATPERNIRESTKGRISGRTHEIQRLIGRALRCIVDLKALGELTVWLDCDVLQADGGTRTAAITGSFLAMVSAFSKLKNDGELKTIPVIDYLAAISVGKVGGEALLDLCFEEDNQAEVDMNIVMTGKKEFVEIQGTAEKKSFSQSELNDFIALAAKGIVDLVKLEKEVLKEKGIELTF